jgi:hypothetical protein
MCPYGLMTESGVTGSYVDFLFGSDWVKLKKKQSVFVLAGWLAARPALAARWLENACDDVANYVAS